MDELLFRSSQKFEHLQYQMGAAAAEGTRALSELKNKTKEVVVETINGPSCVHLRNKVVEFWYYVINAADQIWYSVVYHINPHRLFRSISRTFGSQWSHRDIYFGCAGILVGSIFGIGIGIALSRSHHVLKHMTAVQCTSYSGIEGATLIDDAIQPIVRDDNDIVINVKAASVHIVDGDICRGYGRVLRGLLNKQSYRKHDLPVTLGRDCAGIVIDVGRKVTKFDIGDEVWATSPFWSNGTISQYYVSHQRYVSRKPESIVFESSCSLPYAGCIALDTLKRLEVDPETAQNKRVFIQGCCTPVGCILVQLFKHWNAHVTASCYERAVAVAEAIHCDDIIILNKLNAHAKNGQHGGHRLDEFESNFLVKELSIRDPFDIVINTRNCGVSDFLLKKFCATSAFASTIHPFRAEDAYRIPFSWIFRLYVRMKCFVQGTLKGETPDFGEVHMCSNTLDQLEKYAQSGVLKTLVDRVYAPANIEQALYHIESVDSIGSTVVTFR